MSIDPARLRESIALGLRLARRDADDRRRLRAALATGDPAEVVRCAREIVGGEAEEEPGAGDRADARLDGRAGG